jgi:hypothetical protein
VNLPVGADFYPFYSTRLDRHGCRWQEGGRFIPDTLDDFGGSSITEYGTVPLAPFYPAANGQPQYVYEVFRQVLGFNPCPAFDDDDRGYE